MVCSCHDSALLGFWFNKYWEKNMSNINFIKKNKVLVIYTFLLGLITYAVKLFSFGYGMDTLNFITLQDTYLMHWIEIGRPGMYLFKKYITSQYMNIYIANFCFVFFLCITSLVICNIASIKLVDEQGNQFSEQLRLFIIPSLFITAPLFVQQAYFVLQNIEFSFSMLLVTFTVLLFVMKINNRIEFRLLAIFSLTIAFSCYQSFIIYYIGLLIFVAFLDVHKSWQNGRQTGLINLFKKYCIPIFDMFIAFAGYEIFSKVMLYTFHLKASSYLGGQILWGKKAFSTTLKLTLVSIKNTLLTGFSYSFNVALLIGLIGLVIIWITQYVVKRNNECIFFILLMGLFLDTFFFNILLGNTPASRALVPSYCLVVAIVFFICSLYIKKNALLILLEVLVFLIAGKQIFLTTNLIQADQVRFYQDQAMISRIETQLDTMNINPNDTKLMLVGYHNNVTPLNIQDDLVGESMFEFGDFTGNTSAMTENIVFLMNQGGYNIRAVNNEEFNKEFRKTRKMRTFPQKNSIMKHGNIVIIKLS